MGVLVFRVMCVEVCIWSAMSSPLWSSVGECHIDEWAFMSPDRIELVSEVA